MTLTSLLATASAAGVPWLAIADAVRGKVVMDAGNAYAGRDGDAATAASAHAAGSSGWVASFILKKLNLLRVPIEVELEGLDKAEYETDFYPEHARAPEEIVEPDGTLIPAELLLPRELAAITNGHIPGSREGAEVSG